jgi:ferrochelatase
LATITKAQTEAVRTEISKRYDGGVMVEYCMRYGNPSTQSVVQKMVDAGCQKILFFPLYPQFAGATSATANDEFFRSLIKQTWQPAARTVSPYFDRPDYINALATSIEKAYETAELRPEVLVCSYHGVPKRYLMQGDPYHCQCQKTTRLLKERLGWDDTEIVTTFQSKFGPEEWLQPYTVEEVARMAEKGQKNIAVCAPAFSADCIETLEEINEEIKESFEHAGGEHFTYIPCLNDSKEHIETLSNVISENLQGWI